MVDVVYRMTKALIGPTLDLELPVYWLAHPCQSAKPPDQPSNHRELLLNCMLRINETLPLHVTYPVAVEFELVDAPTTLFSRSGKRT